MKQIKLILACALLTMVSRGYAQSVVMTAGDVTIEAGKTATLTCSMENSMEMAGWQMFLSLPEGIDIAFDEEEGERYYDDTVVLSSRHKRSHTCTVTQTADGGYLIMAYNPSKPTAITGNSGELVSITLQAAATYSGVGQAVIKNVAASDMFSVQTNMTDNITVNIAESHSSGISKVEGAAESQPAYNLQGVRVDPQKAGRGVYIQQGKKWVK